MGRHAAEYLLWEQDLNGTGPGAAALPHTNFVTGSGCISGNCDRRAAYLRADVDEMAAARSPGGATHADATALPMAGLTAILTGMGSLSDDELAGERMKLCLMLNDTEEELTAFATTATTTMTSAS